MATSLPMFAVLLCGRADATHAQLSIARQCDLLGIARSSWYYQPRGETAANVALMRLLDEQYTRTPFYGVERMTAWLQQ